jgi:hypothetical protein
VDYATKGRPENFQSTSLFPILALFTAPQSMAADALILHSPDLPELAVPLYTNPALAVCDLRHSALYGPNSILFVIQILLPF